MFVSGFQGETIIIILIHSYMKKKIFKSPKGPIIFTDPCPTSPASKAVEVIQAVAMIAAIIFSVTRRQ